MNAVALDRDGQADRNIAGAEPVVVHLVLEAEHSVRNLPDRVAQAPFGASDDLLEAVAQRRQAVGPR